MCFILYRLVTIFSLQISIAFRGRLFEYFTIIYLKVSLFKLSILVGCLPTSFAQYLYFQTMRYRRLKYSGVKDMLR